MKTLGIDLGGTRIKFGITEQGTILHETGCDTPHGRAYPDVLKKIAEHALALLERFPETSRVGIGSPGLVDAETGRVLFSNNFGWSDVPLKTDLENAVGKEVRIANDASCAALGEALYGAGKGFERMALLTIGTGVGGGFIRNKEPETDGFGSMAYLFGHMVVSFNGKTCNCGRRGCLEAYASAAAIEEKGTAVFGVKTTAREVFDLARSGDRIAGSILDEFLEYLGAGAVSIANLLRPQVIVIGGGVSDSCDLILPRLNEDLEKGVYAYSCAPVRAVCAKLGNHAGIVGAAALKRHKKRTE